MAIKPRKEEKTYTDPPVWWVGSLPEWLVYEALLKLGFKDRFTYQSSRMGGRLSKGGAVVDFEIPELNLAINVQSVYYHYSTTSQRIIGEMQRVQLESMGLRVIYINEADILRNALYYVGKAIRGE